MKGFRICRIFGIDIEIDFSLLIIFGLIVWQLSAAFSWLGAVAGAVLFIFSIVFHEMAHSLTARRFNITVRKITLWMFGGIAQTEQKDGFGSPKAEFLISIAGPFSSIFLAGMFFFLAGGAVASSKLAASVLIWLFYINVILVVFNLIPLFPMDGGRILRSLIWWKTKNLIKATRITRDTAIVFAVLLPIAGFFWGGWFSVLWLGFIAWRILIPAVFAEYKMISGGKNDRS